MDITTDEASNEAIRHFSQIFEKLKMSSFKANFMVNSEILKSDSKACN